MDDLPPPGYYDDPREPGTRRYWNGYSWDIPPQVASTRAAIGADKKSHRWAWLLPLIIAVATPVLLQNPTVGRNVCASNAIEWRVADTALRFLCKDSFQRLDDRQATDYVDTLFAREGGAKRESYLVSYGLLTDAVTAADLVGSWHPLIRVERTGPVTRTGDNEFSVPVMKYVVPSDRIELGTFYAGDLKMYAATMTVQLGMERGHVRGNAPSFHDVDPAGLDHQRRANANVLTDFYHQPARRTDKMMNVGRGTPIWELCQLEVRDEPERWWARTYLGWIPHVDINDGDDAPVDGLPMCTYHSIPKSF